MTLLCSLFSLKLKTVDPDKAITRPMQKDIDNIGIFAYHYSHSSCSFSHWLKYFVSYENFFQLSSEFDTFKLWSDFACRCLSFHYKYRNKFGNGFNIDKTRKKKMGKIMQKYIALAACELKLCKDLIKIGTLYFNEF